MGAAPLHELLTLLKLRVMYTNNSHEDSSINNSEGGLAINYTHLPKRALNLKSCILPIFLQEPLKHL